MNAGERIEDLTGLLAMHGVVEEVELRSKLGLCALHGGGLERATEVVAREVAERTGATLVDVRQLFDEYGHARQRYFNIDLIHDDCHPTPLGHQLIAETLAKLILDSRRGKGGETR